MKIILLTPKAYSKLDQSKLDQSKLEQFKPYKIEPTHDIYMNMLDGWTEDECDNVAYIVDEDFLYTRNPDGHTDG